MENLIIKNIIVTISLLLLITPTIAYADNLSSPSYHLQMSTLNTTGGNKSSPNFKLSDTIGQTAQGEFNSTGIKVKAGFQYVRTPIPFSFKIDNLYVNFGSILPNHFQTATNTLTVVSGVGFTVKTIENHSLAIPNTSYTIPNTSCDPDSPCHQTQSNFWNSTTAYGFGYSLKGDDIDKNQFPDDNHFRPFPDNLLGESPIIIMSKNERTTKSSATITYKINISPTQKGGIYENSIQYLALPSF